MKNNVTEYLQQYLQQKFPPDLVTFTEEFLNEEPLFLCNKYYFFY